jgi:hypothetical protein
MSVKPVSTGGAGGTLLPLEQPQPSAAPIPHANTINPIRWGSRFIQRTKSLMEIRIFKVV